MASLTNVTATKIQNASGTLLASGTLYAQGTDASGKPISYQIGGGGATVTSPVSVAVTNGSIGTNFYLADPSQTVPAGIYFHIWVIDSTTNKIVIDYPFVQWAGLTFNLDNYAPTANVNAPLGSSINGPLVVGGNLTVTGTISGSAPGSGPFPKMQSFSAATTWTFTHNSGTQSVMVQCFDSSYKLIIPDNLQNTDVNTTVATFLQAQSGYMIISVLGNYTPAVSNPNNIIGNPTSSQSIAGDFPLTIGGSVTTKRLNGQRIAEQFTGTGGTAINNALADLGSSTGRVIADEGMVSGTFNAPANGQSVWDFRQTQDILGNSPAIATRPTFLSISQTLGEFSTANLTGTVTLTNGSTAVTGVGTKFTTECNPNLVFGPAIRLSSDGVTTWAIVASVTDDTHATLQSAYTGTGGTGTAVIMVGQEGLLIQGVLTGGTPNDYKTGEWVGLSVFGNRTAGHRGLYGANINLTYHTPVQSNQGQVIGLEIDMTNSSGINDPNGGLGIAIDINGAGANKSFCGIYAVSAGFEYQAQFANWGTAGVYMQGSQNHLILVPTANNSNPAIQGQNAVGANIWNINNDGSSQFPKTMTLTTTTGIPLILQGSGSQALLQSYVPAGFFGGMQFTTNGTQRWLLGKNGTAEGGSNTGSDFEIDRYNDAGVFQSTPLSINRASGLITVNNGMALSGGIISDTFKLTAAAPTVIAGQVGLGSTTATSATAGANGAVPAQVVGYLIANVAGTAVKIPYFAT